MPINKLTVTRLTLIIGLSCLVSFNSCETSSQEVQGRLFIIGGGEKGYGMLNELVKLSGVRQEGYMFVLPMASSLPDSAIIWAKEDFSLTGIKKITGFNFRKGAAAPADKLDSLRNARLVYISGGDQARFMDAVRNTTVATAIDDACRNGAIISGTSAGAAVMSRKMITGNQIKHPDPSSTFSTIEASNIELADGLGLITGVIIDQHFIRRQRLNRLISVSIENPDDLCVGIDESTAIFVEGSTARVIGEGQVIVIKNRLKKSKARNGLLGTENLELSVYLPGETFRLK